MYPFVVLHLTYPACAVFGISSSLARSQDKGFSGSGGRGIVGIAKFHPAFHSVLDMAYKE